MEEKIMSESVTYSTRDISDKLAEKYGITKKDAQEYTRGVFDLLASTIVDSNLGEEVKVPGVGVFKTVMSKGGIRRNPATQEKCEVKPKRRVKFRALPKFKSTLEENVKA
jgi:nucleoid DNA-binding protein